MTLNLKLKPVRDVDRDFDDLDRTWVGYSPAHDPTLTFGQNRGIWVIGAAAGAERLATMSFEGAVVVVVELEGIERVPSKDRTRRDRGALVGRVLGPGDPDYDRLLGSPVDRHRNPVTYLTGEDAGDGPRAGPAGPYGPGWTPADTPLEALEALGAEGLDADQARASLEVMLSQPASEAYLLVEAILPSAPDGTLARMVPRTRIWVNPSELRDAGWDASVIGGSVAAGQSLSVALVVAAARRLASGTRLLSADEVAVYAAVESARSAASGPTAQEVARVADSVPDVPDVLRRLADKGVLREVDGGWRKAG